MKAILLLKALLFALFVFGGAPAQESMVNVNA